MYQLSEQETDRVYERLHKEGLKSLRLEQDLFDHFCCYMEERMETAGDFEKAYREATTAIAPNGTQEIEFELFFIMNFKKQMSMKRFIFLAGFAATFLLSTGTMFKTMHWFGANIMLFLGFAVLLLTALVAVVHLVRFLSYQPASFRFRTVTGISAACLISLGFIFKTLHFPGANVMIGLGTIILNFVFLPMFFYHIYKHGFIKTPAHETA